MPEVKDPAIKLFGRNILVPEIQIPLDSLQVSDLEYQQPQLMDECLDATKIEVEDPPVENSYQLGSSSNLDKAEDNNCQTLNSENEAKVSNKREEDQGTERDMGNQEKVLKKPDKVLPCPRCNSLNTKFCYFNNYNMNQPRHFCKNCQRYWTAGGTMRNVPVGAGRRKNKHLSLQYRQEVVPPDAVSGSQANTLNSAGNHHLSYVGIPSSSIPVKGIGEVLKFGTDAPLCESMETALNLKDQKRSVEMGSVVVEGNCGEPSSSGSSFSSTTCWENELSERKMEQASLRGHSNCFTPMHPLQFYPCSPLAYPLNPSWNAVMFGPDGSNSNPAQNGSPPIVAVPGFCTPSITIPCVSASYWGCMPSWNMPLAGTGNHSLSSSTSNSGCSGNSSPTLGKHSRDGNLQAEEKTEQCLWVPKTLRIDGPNEAAKSSIWATLGIKPDQSKPIRRGGIFKAFQPKSDTSSNTSDGDQVMEANPAALSRSQSFQEST